MSWDSWREYVEERGGLTSLEFQKGIDRPIVITLCGSTRFVDTFNSFRQGFTLKGMIVLSIEIVTTQQREEDPQHVNRPNKEMLDLLHKEKIKMSDCVFVINQGGYIGDSTRSEIQFAESLGLPIEYMEEEGVLNPMSDPDWVPVGQWRHD